MYWNYRFVRESADEEADEWIELKEVYYDTDNKIIGYADAHVGGLNEEQVKHVAERVLFASRQSILSDKDLTKIGGDDNV